MIYHSDDAFGVFGGRCRGQCCVAGCAILGVILFFSQQPESSADWRTHRNRYPKQSRTSKYNNSRRIHAESH